MWGTALILFLIFLQRAGYKIDHSFIGSVPVFLYFMRQFWFQLHFLSCESTSAWCIICSDLRFNEYRQFNDRGRRCQWWKERAMMYRCHAKEIWFPNLLGNVEFHWLSNTADQKKKNKTRQNKSSFFDVFFFMKIAPYQVTTWINY